MSSDKKIDYDDILSSMNLYVENGQLRIIKGPQSSNGEAPKQLNFGPKLTEEEIEKKKKDEEEKNKRIFLEKLQHQKNVVGLQKARTKYMSYINNYPEQIVQDIPQRTTAIFPINYWR